MNYMKQVAEMFGVALGEEFKIKGNVEKWYFTEDGLQIKGAIKGANDICNDMMNSLLCGVLKVVKNPWLPKNGETYFRIVVPGDARIISESEWCGLAADYTNFAAGNCFRSEDEAKTAMPWFCKNIERINRGESWEARK